MKYLKYLNEEIRFPFWKKDVLIVPIIIDNKQYNYRLIKMRSNMMGNKWFFNLSGDVGEVTIKYDVDINQFKLVRICNLIKKPRLTDDSKNILLDFIKNKKIIDYLPWDDNWVWV